MKKTIFKSIFVLHSLFFVLESFCQAPQFINYQGIARNAAGPIANGTVGLRLTIRTLPVGGSSLYQEIHNPVHTNPYGLLNVEIGAGDTINFGTFNTIDWANGAKYLEVYINTGNGYLLVGSTQLISVPYAIYSNNSRKSDTATVALTTTDSLVAARYASTSIASIGTAYNIINFDSKVYDTYNAVTTGSTWHFTAPVEGKYSVKASYNTSSSTAASGTERFYLVLFNNTANSIIQALDIYTTYSTTACTKFVQGTADIQLAAGDKIDIRVKDDVSTNHSLNGNIGDCVVAIHRIGK